MAKAASLVALAIGGLIIADLWAHYRTTKAVLDFGSKESRYLAGR
jgi:hypothetical protein